MADPFSPIQMHFKGKGSRQTAWLRGSSSVAGPRSDVGLVSWAVKTFRPRETGDAKLNLACCHNCELESTWFARSAVSDLVAPMRTPHLDHRDEGLHAEDVHDP
jgi:hypothetical protein